MSKNPSFLPSIQDAKYVYNLLHEGKLSKVKLEFGFPPESFKWEDINVYLSYEMFLLATKGLSYLREYLGTIAKQESGFSIWFQYIYKPKINQDLTLAKVSFSKINRNDELALNLKLLSYFFNKDNFWALKLPIFYYSSSLLDNINDINLILLTQCIYKNHKYVWNKFGLIPNMPLNDPSLIFKSMKQYYARSLPQEPNMTKKLDLSQYTLAELDYFFETSKFTFRDTASLFYGSIGFVASWGQYWTLQSNNCDPEKLSIGYRVGPNFDDYFCIPLSDLENSK